MGDAVFAVETHILYRRELTADAAIVVQTRLVAAGAKRLHLAHEMSSDGHRVAMQEGLFVHVAPAARRVVVFDPVAAARIAARAPASSDALPDWLGRRIALPFPPA